MSIQSKRELAVTQKKLRGLEEQYATTEAETPINAYAHGLTLRSLRRTIIQLKEEIARHEAKAGLKGSKGNGTF